MNAIPPMPTPATLPPRKFKTVLALRGLPASGKSTYALELQSAAPAGTVVRINNDELSTALYGAPWLVGDYKVIARVRMEALRAALASLEVQTVILDNTNLEEQWLRELEAAAQEAGARFVVDDRFLQVDAATCLARDAARSMPVGPEVIERMAAIARTLGPWVPSRPRAQRRSSTISNSRRTQR